MTAALIFAVAALYGSVGQAGASGYLAVMALLAVPAETMKPTALVLNVLVASLATWNFRRAGQFYPRALLPLALGSVPLAWVGGTMLPSSPLYRPLVAAVLALAALRMLVPRKGEDRPGEPRIPWVPALLLGAGIGLVAGFTGTGGGVFLSPALVLLGWAGVRQSAGVTAPFILLNSLAALAGTGLGPGVWSAETAIYAVAAGVGGFLGSWLGANRLPERPLTVALGVVLALAAVRLGVG